MKNYLHIIIFYLSLIVFAEPNLIAQECDIWVVAKNADNSLLISLSGLNSKGIKPIRAGNITELRDNVIQTLQNGGCCLKNLYIIGHGEPGLISLNGHEAEDINKTISVTNESKWKQPLSDILNKSCSGTPGIYLFGCNVGESCEGSDFLFKMAKDLGTVVKAPIDKVDLDIYSKDPSYYLNYGRWQEASNSMSSPPICISHQSQQELEEREKAIERMWYCPCNEAIYMSEQDCAASCPSGLACFTSSTECETAYKNNTFDRYMFEPILGRDYWVSPSIREKNVPLDFDRHGNYSFLNSSIKSSTVKKEAASWTIGVSQPCVIKESNGYQMWFIGWDENDINRIGYATSHYGFDWEEYYNNPILTEGNSGSWDDKGVYSPCVIKDGDTYKMWYTGYSNSDGLARIGYATSSDGIKWTKHLTPVLSEGSSGTWESDGVGAPSVIKDGEIYKMWYEGSDVDWWWRIGYATSTDGINWTRYSNNPVISEGQEGSWDEWGVGAPSVVKVDNSFYMWYGGIDSYNIGRIGWAVSQNGYEWTESVENPVIDRDYGESWDNVDVAHPSVVINNNEQICEMWYRGLNDSNYYSIGYANAPINSLLTGIKDLHYQKTIFESFALYQNYPNPFNPTTKIGFRVADFGLVSLKVFDLLGREVATLINEEKPAGAYEVTWNAANLPSGVYFYQLKATPIGGQAGSYTITKKLLLLK